MMLRYPEVDGDLDTIQHAIDDLLRRIRAVPAVRDQDGRLRLDLSPLTGQRPIDVDELSPSGALAEMDLTQVEVNVKPGAPGLSGADGIVIAIVGGCFLTGTAELVRRNGLGEFWHRVVLPYLRTRVSSQVVTGDPEEITPADAASPSIAGVAPAGSPVDTGNRAAPVGNPAYHAHAVSVHSGEPDHTAR
jgi:hypothetical protein